MKIAASISIFAMSMSLAASAQSVVPNQLFPSEFLDVHAPNETGWRMAKISSRWAAFVKEGQPPDRGYGAQVFVFPLENANTPDELLAVVDAGLKNDPLRSQYVVESEILRHTEERGYPCVRHQTVVHDMPVVVDTFTHKAVKLRIYSLYCRHPNTKERGFMATYTYKGSDNPMGLASLADSFIAGTHVSKKP